MIHIVVQNMNPKMNPKSEPDCCEMLQLTCLHACQPNYYSHLLVMLYFDKYITIQSQICFLTKNNHIKQTKVLIECLQSIHSFCSRAHVPFGTKLEVLITYFLKTE